MKHGGVIPREPTPALGRMPTEEHRLSMRMYFRDELLLLLERAGFEPVRVEAGYTGAEPTADDDFLVFIASG